MLDLLIAAAHQRGAVSKTATLRGNGSPSPVPLTQ